MRAPLSFPVVIGVRGQGHRRWSWLSRGFYSGHEKKLRRIHQRPDHALHALAPVGAEPVSRRIARARGEFLLLLELRRLGIEMVLRLFVVPLLETVVLEILRRHSLVMVMGVRPREPEGKLFVNVHRLEDGD